MPARYAGRTDWSFPRQCFTKHCALWKRPEHLHCRLRLQPDRVKPQADESRAFAQCRVTLANPTYSHFGDIVTRTDRKERCDLRLIQGDRMSKPLLGETRREKIWEGSRKGDKGEHFRLYRKTVKG
jgi:hypothetical protein